MVHKKQQTGCVAWCMLNRTSISMRAIVKCEQYHVCAHKKDAHSHEMQKKKTIIERRKK